jgi:hypothetical protein
MTGYAAFGRVERGRMAEPDPWSPRDADVTFAESALIDDWASAPIAWSDGLAARLVRLRETWAMTTFYLFDPDSWR